MANLFCEAWLILIPRRVETVGGPQEFGVYGTLPSSLAPRAGVSFLRPLRLRVRSWLFPPAPHPRSSISRAIFVPAFRRTEVHCLAAHILGDGGIARHVSAADRVLIESSAGSYRRRRRIAPWRSGTSKTAEESAQNRAQEQKEQQRKEKLADESREHAVGAGSRDPAPDRLELTSSSFGRWDS